MKHSWRYVAMYSQNAGKDKKQNKGTSGGRISLREKTRSKKRTETPGQKELPFSLDQKDIHGL